MGGGPESRCVGRVYGLDDAVRHCCIMYFNLLHDEEARSNNFQIFIYYVVFR